MCCVWERGTGTCLFFSSPLTPVPPPEKSSGKLPSLLLWFFSLPSKCLLPLCCALLASYVLIFQQTPHTSNFPEHLTYSYSGIAAEPVCLNFPRPDPGQHLEQSGVEQILQQSCEMDAVNGVDSVFLPPQRDLSIVTVSLLLFQGKIIPPVFR